ncbi:uncharacterized protein LOC111284496 [Durio zibethinus]|uniref:Uncharacterized protein LOC111284496 n=1 Tax=Durio zibethinus TaxID=66656 RepID=A0A6P5XM01_DURZI|nr:uncharacterized protein LOC111284496 [Durio zibethinus]XP_022728903.1 uncharacterized protein LOC111284496 [Durio zibethinus]XP_022728909.1 uncharacterized protein LOC111284496 [Durio zibethinus]XP_022728916.1 uncharacterized protein LOC111284496 [Durio zibethinus]XP_022728926.1 uncharacterized protein LOC111284496 [Durio zibethinus]XP_022728934.1 uncharacterized protein LOC111284496 [Durio zibethinus]XP_022728940.1 uncharacterized protein LOC111284496 [Durio zibethinus]
MLVLSMNSKRQRRPNVRLGEIGDVSAAFACGFSQKNNESLVHKRWKPDFLNSQENELATAVEFCKGNSPNFLISDPGVSSRISAELQQNRENKNLNSSKLGSNLISADEIDMMKSTLNFGTITRKSRVMKRRGRSREGNNCSFGSAWNWSSKLSPQFSSEDRKELGEKEFMGIGSNVCADYYPDNGFQDMSDHEMPATSKDACEYDADEPGYGNWQQGNTDGFWKDACFEGNDVFLKSRDIWDQTRYPCNDVTSVRRWLEDLGFGRYASVFEMHEVDEETLPLLTLDDLKEMGVFAVGHRRKIYSAIQQLRGSDVSC